jgi:hypothetical protein
MLATILRLTATSAGEQMDPSVSVPSAAGAKPAETPTALPVLLPTTESPRGVSVRVHTGITSSTHR